MPSYLPLVTQQVLIAAQAEPVRSSHSGVLSVVLALHDMGSQPGDLLLEEYEAFLCVICICLLSQEKADFIDFIPDVSDLLTITIVGALFFL